MDQFESAKELAEKLKNDGVLKTPANIAAFEKIDRKDFVIDFLKNDAYLNAPLGIGFGQTISQPHTVAFMLEALQAETGNKILDIGFGSGWQAALLAEVAGPDGKVFGLEILPELCEFGRQNVDKYNFLKENRIDIFCRDGALGLAEAAPFDRIISAAALPANEEPPAHWQDQLKIGGRLVFPSTRLARSGQALNGEGSLWLWEKKGENDFVKTEFPGFVFVPLIKAKDNN